MDYSSGIVIWYGMSFEDYQQKSAVVIVYDGEGKGKTSASLGLMARALGSGLRVAFIQFIKHWTVGEHHFIKQIQPLYKQNLVFYKGGRGFYQAADLSAANVSDTEHQQSAKKTYDFALQAVGSGDYDLVVCDEINNAVQDGLLTKKQLEVLLNRRREDVSLCLSGRGFPHELLPLIDIATEMKKTKHHFDDKFLANAGIDY